MRAYVEAIERTGELPRYDREQPRRGARPRALGLGAGRVPSRSTSEQRPAPLHRQVPGVDADDDGDVAAARAAQDDAGAAVGAVRAERLLVAAGLARAAQQVVSSARTSASRPATPLPSMCRSVISSSRGSEALGVDGARVVPGSTSRVATCSTNGVGPQTKQRGRASGPGPTSASIAASTRRAKPSHPGGASRVKVQATSRPARGSSASSSSR